MVAHFFLAKRGNKLRVKRTCIRFRSRSIYFQFELLAIDDHSRYLLIHENQNGRDTSRNRCDENRPRRILAKERYNPAAIMRPSRFEFRWDVQFRRVQTQHGIPRGHQHDGDEHCEITEDGSNLGGKERTATKLLQHHANEEGQHEQQHGVEEDVRMVDRRRAA